MPTNLLFASFQNIYQFCEHYLSGIFVAFCLFRCCQENQINPPEGQFLILQSQSEIVLTMPLFTFCIFPHSQIHTTMAASRIQTPVWNFIFRIKCTYLGREWPISHCMATCNYLNLSTLLISTAFQTPCTRNKISCAHGVSTY